MVRCSNCGKEGLQWIYDPHTNSRGERIDWTLAEQNEKQHRCTSLKHKDTGANIAHSTGKGILCGQGCGTMIFKDESLPEPQLREVVKVTTTDGRTVDDMDHGKHHTVERCIEIKEHKHLSLTEDQQYVKWMVALDEQRRELGKHFDKTKQFYPADLFILAGFYNNKTPYYVRNPLYHDEDGNYIL